MLLWLLSIVSKSSSSDISVNLNTQNDEGNQVQQIEEAKDVPDNNIDTARNLMSVLGCKDNPKLVAEKISELVTAGKQIANVLQVLTKNGVVSSKSDISIPNVDFEFGDIPNEDIIQPEHEDDYIDVSSAPYHKFELTRHAMLGPKLKSFYSKQLEIADG